MPYEPRMLLKTRTRSNGDKVLYCIFDLGKGLEFSFRPKWDEVLDLAAHMVDTEHKNDGKRLRYVVRELHKITRKGQRYLSED